MVALLERVFWGSHSAITEEISLLRNFLLKINVLFLFLKKQNINILGIQIYYKLL